ncbi:MAG: hypothetical protein ACPGO5_03240 [Patescibacteria group bacterium]
MTPEKWSELKSSIERENTVLESGVESEGEHVSIDYIEFEKDSKTYRFEFKSQDKILDSKTIYSNRIGATGIVQKQYDETDKTYTFTGYILSEDGTEWLNM